MRRRIVVMLAVMLGTSMLLSGYVIQQGRSESLLGFWDFEEGTGTTATDKGGKNRNGDIQGALWVNHNQKVLERPASFNGTPPRNAIWGEYGLYFDGRDKVRIPMLFDTSPTEITIDAFIAAENPLGDHQTIFWHGHPGSFELFVYGGSLYFGVQLAEEGGYWRTVQVGFYPLGFGIAAGRVTAIWKRGSFMRLLFYPYIKYPNEYGWFSDRADSVINVPDRPLSDPGVNFYASIGCYSQLVDDSKYFYGTIDRVKVYNDVVYPQLGELYPPDSEGSHEPVNVYPPDPLEPGVLAWWRFTDGGGPSDYPESINPGAASASRQLTDWSGRNNHGTIRGSKLWYSQLRAADQPFPYSLRFDGYVNYVRYPTLFGANSVTGITVSALIRPVNNLTFQTIVRHGENGEFELSISEETLPQGSLSFSVCLTDGIWYRAYTKLPKVGSWIYVVGTWSKNEYVRLNVNGEVKEAYVPNLYLRALTSGYVSTIGARIEEGSSTDVSREYQGRIDGVKIYSTAINQQKITEDMSTLGGSRPYPPQLESTDSAGNVKNSFSIGEPVYVSGAPYTSSSSYNIYVVNNTALYEGMSIPARVSGTATSVTTDEVGIIVYSNLETSGTSPALLWTSATNGGRYDIVIDMNNDGKYNSAIDAVDDLAVLGSGFDVSVPEPPLEMLTPIAMSVILIWVALSKRKKRKGLMPLTQINTSIRAIKY